MEEKNNLRFGYFQDFYEPTFMFSGDGNSLEALHNALLGLSSIKRIEIGRNNGFQPFAGELLTLRLTEKAEGLKYHFLSKPASFEWCLSEEQALLFAQKVKSVIEGPKPCHDYLDTGVLDDVVVLVSKDEYPIKFPQCG